MRGSEGLPNCHVMSLFLLTKYQLLELAIISGELAPAQPGSLDYLTDVIMVSPDIMWMFPSCDVGPKSQKGPHIQISKMCYMG